LVSVIVPARDEEEVVPRCLASLLAQDYGNLEMIVVDDHSTDGTADRVREFAESSGRVRLLSCPDPGPGWVGKNNACYTGARNARGRWLLFVDADTRLAAGAVSAAVSYAESNGLDALSLMPKIEPTGFVSRFTFPVIGFLIRIFYPIRGVNSGRGRAFFYGGFTLFRADAYWGLGGHGAVRGEVVEDKALGELARSHGLRIRVLVGRDMVTSQVGGRTARDMWFSVQRVVSSVFRGRRLSAALFSLLLPTIFWLPYISLVGALLLGGAYSLLLAFASVLAYAATLLTDVAIDQESNPLYVFLTPLGSLLIGASVLHWAVVNPGVVAWKGRRYRLVVQQAGGLGALVTGIRSSMVDHLHGPLHQVVGDSAPLGLPVDVGHHTFGHAAGAEPYGPDGHAVEGLDQSNAIFLTSHGDGGGLRELAAVEAVRREPDDLPSALGGPHNLL
jgi:glycosyltransferase involved in cell wall biosynthesis